MKNLIFSVALFALSLPLHAAQTALAQSVIGTTEYNGQTIELLDNNSWRFKQSSNNTEKRNCETIKQSFEFCNSLNWLVVEPIGQASAMYQINDRAYVMFIVEGLGTQDGMSGEYMINAAHYMAAQGMNIQQESLDVNYTRQKQLKGYDYWVTSYSGSINGLPFTFINNINVGKTSTVQAVVYGVGGLTKKLESQSSEMLARITFLN